MEKAMNDEDGGLYNEESIRRHAPTHPGVYLLTTHHAITGAVVPIYVGESEDIQDRLLQHVKAQSDQAKCINLQFPEVFQYELIDDQQLRWFREQSLKRELNPICNKQ